MCFVWLLGRMWGRRSHIHVMLVSPGAAVLRFAAHRAASSDQVGAFRQVRGTVRCCGQGMSSCATPPPIILRPCLAAVGATCLACSTGGNLLRPAPPLSDALIRGSPCFSTECSSRAPTPRSWKTRARPSPRATCAVSAPFPDPLRPPFALARGPGSQRRANLVHPSTHAACSHWPCPMAGRASRASRAPHRPTHPCHKPCTNRALAAHIAPCEPHTVHARAHADKDTMTKLFDPEGCARVTVIHLAALLSGYSEEKFDEGMKVRVACAARVVPQLGCARPPPRARARAVLAWRGRMAHRASADTG